MMIITDHGVLETIAFTNDVEIRRRLLDKAREEQGDVWYDNYDERMRVVNQLHAASTRA
jgi:hypothetical protein